MADQNHTLNSNSATSSTTEAHLQQQQVQAATQLAALQQGQLRQATMEEERRKAEAHKLLDARRRAQQQQQAATNSYVFPDDNGDHGTSCLARTSTSTTSSTTATGATAAAATAAAAAANHNSTIHNSIYALTEHGLLRALNGGGGVGCGHATVHTAGVPWSVTTTEDPLTASASARASVFNQSAASMAATNSPMSSSNSSSNNNNNTNNNLDNAISTLLQRAQQQHSNSMRQLEELQALRTLQQGFGASTAGASTAGAGAGAGGYHQHHRLPFLAHNSSDLSSLLAAAAPNHHHRHHHAAFAASHHHPTPLGDCLETLRLRASLLGASLRPEDFSAFHHPPEQQQQQQQQTLLELGFGATTPQEAVALYASYRRAAAAAAANHRDQGPSPSAFSAPAAAAPAPSLFAALTCTENEVAAPATTATTTTVANHRLLKLDSSRNVIATTTPTVAGVAASAPQDQQDLPKKKGTTPRTKNVKATATKSSASKKQPPQEMAAAAHPQDDEEDDDEEESPIPDLPTIRPLPPLEEGDTPHYSERMCVPLATEEDANWLSERQVFIRAELLEVVRASHQDVLVRSSSKSVAYQQVGIRCKFCAHLHPSARAIRSSAYPSSIRQMYQSFTMMVRDHWAGCTALPPKLKRRFLNYQEHKIPSSSLSREYWAFAAEKIGMVNTENGGGMTITPESMQAALSLPSFGTTPEHVGAMQDVCRQSEPLVTTQEATLMSPYLHLLLSQAEVCYLLESERVGKRKDAPVGLSGFGCRHCIAQGRLGFCRVFPLNKRSLPTKVNDLYTHLQRCSLTPAATRALLCQYKRDVNGNNNKKSAGRQKHTSNNGHFAERDREYIDQIWTKLGRKGAQI